MKTRQDLDLALFNVPREAMLPLLSSLRLVNTMADALFYDVGELYRHLSADGYSVRTAANKEVPENEPSASCREAIATHIVNLGTLANPEGVILAIDALCPPT